MFSLLYSVEDLSFGLVHPPPPHTLYLSLCPSYWHPCSHTRLENIIMGRPIRAFNPCNKKQEAPLSNYAVVLLNFTRKETLIHFMILIYTGRLLMIIPLIIGYIVVYSNKVLRFFLFSDISAACHFQTKRK